MLKTYDVAGAIRVLEGSRIDFRPRVGAYLNKLRQYEDGFYQRTLKKDGTEAAEAELNEVAERRHLREYAGVIHPIVESLVELLRAPHDKRDPLLCAVRCADEEPHFWGMRGGLLVSVVLPQPHGCGCQMPEGANIFAHFGYLPITAVAVNCNGQESQLSLFFSLMGEDKGKDGFAQVVIDTNGNYNAGSSVRYACRDAFLLTSMGICEQDEGLRVSFSGGPLSTALPFPGAEEFLFKHISEVAPYISALAKHLSHEH